MELSKSKRPVIPPLCGITEVAKILEINRTTIPRARKLKTFPEPITHIGNRPYWLESEINEYKCKRDLKKNYVEAEK